MGNGQVCVCVFDLLCVFAISIVESLEILRGFSSVKCYVETHAGQLCVCACCKSYCY